MPARAMVQSKGKGKQRQAESVDEMQVDQNGASSEEATSGGDEEEPDLAKGDLRTAQQQRETRQRLRAHATKVIEAKTNATSVGYDALEELLKRTDLNFKKIRTTDEAAIDSMTIGSIADIAQQKARHMRSEQHSFDCQDWLYKVRRFLYPALDAADDDGDDGPRQPSRSEMYRGWTALGYIAAKHTHRVPAMDFMLGPLAVEPKKRKERDATQTQRKSQKISERERVIPTEVTEQDVKRDEHATDQAVKRVILWTFIDILVSNFDQLHQLLEDKGGEEGLNFFEFVINPDSYAQTIENLFHLSFLVKNGKAGFNETDGNDEPFEDGPKISASPRRRALRAALNSRTVATVPRDPSERSELQAGGEDTSGRQIVLEMTEALWKEAIELFGIRTSTIPTRKVEQTGQQASGWYA